MTLRSLAAAVSVLALATTGPADTFKITNGASKIEFTGTKKDGKHNGGFKKFTGTIDLTGTDFAKAKVKVEIQAASLFTDNDMLTAHLKSPDFFDVRTHPTAGFTSSTIRAVSGDMAANYLMTGELKLHGVTKTVSIPVRAEVSDSGVTLNGTFSIQRKDFGMTYGEGKVDNAVTVRVSVQAAR
jgi:polyisoprenoid-binding protein YceI